MADHLKKALRGVMDVLESLAHPTVNPQVLRQIGVKIGRDRALEYRRHHKVQQPFSKKNYVRCMEYLGQWWECGFRKVEENVDCIVFQVSTCPFWDLATQNPNICEIESGAFGGVAGDEFGFAKICTFRGEGSPPKNCHVLVHITPTKRNLGAEGVVYPEDLAARYDLREGRTSGTPLRVLSAREREVLRCIGEGLSDKEVADALHVSVRTAEGHVARIRAKLETRRRADLIRYALRHQLSGI